MRAKESMKNFIYCIMLTALSGVSGASRQKHALEQFELEQLEVFYVSDVGCDGERFAYIADPEELLHRVHVGDYMGGAQGRVIEISNDGVVVVQLKLKGDVWEEVERRLDYLRQKKTRPNIGQN